MLTSFVEAAVEERIDKFVVETPDPFPDEDEPEAAQVAAKPDFFANRKAVQSAKPLPPPIDAEEEKSTQRVTDVPTRLLFVRMTRYTGREGDFLSIIGDDGYDEYETLVRVPEVRTLLK